MKTTTIFPFFGRTKKVLNDFEVFNDFDVFGCIYSPLHLNTLREDDNRSGIPTSNRIRLFH